MIICSPSLRPKRNEQKQTNEGERERASEGIKRGRGGRGRVKRRTGGRGMCDESVRTTEDEEGE